MREGEREREGKNEFEDDVSFFGMDDSLSQFVAHSIVCAVAKELLLHIISSSLMCDDEVCVCVCVYFF